MAVKWTEEQQQVIDGRQENILVSAAAGSGKTAVLVERIIGRLTRDCPPLDVDRLLVVTYTEAAAAEMKERIGDAIEQALLADPGNLDLKRQASLIHSAKIMTIHSFCLSVIKEHFHSIDLDPGFRVAEEGELKLLRQEVLQELLEDRYEKGGESFLRFVETFASGKKDTALETLILELYEYSGAYPDPEAWLRYCVDVYRKGLAPDSLLVQKIIETVRESIRIIQNNVKDAKRICLSPGGPHAYEKTLEKDEELLEKIGRCETYDEMYEALGGKESIRFARLAANRDEACDPEKVLYVQGKRLGWKEEIKNLKEQFFYQSPEEMEEDLALCAPVAEELADLVLEFGSRFSEKKEQKNLIDFRDMEHFALRILARREGDAWIPTEVAQDYQDQFEEVMVDEYQDSNLLQETILTSVSRNSRGGHNFFMVGDVKQSIYRFRLARPEIFMGKYERFSRESGPDRRIDLHKNFRSRTEVLDSVNMIFRQIMKKELGGLTYDKNAALYAGAAYPPSGDKETEILLIDAEGDRQEKAAGEETDQELEARAVAARIHRLMETQQVWDMKKEEFRPLEYRDIVILFRSLKNWSDVVGQVLAEAGIPAFSVSREGYFETMEIGWLMDYLRVLDNFRQDIPLAAVCTSPFGQLTNGELAVIREKHPQDTFSDALVAALQESDVEDARWEGIRKKLLDLFARMESFRAEVPHKSIYDLLWEILEKTGYRDFISAMPGGEQRAANVEMLLNRAKAFESASYKGLYHFVRYVDQLQKYSVEFGEAGIYDEQTDAVRLMSIHKSKGLEFPVVIVMGMGKPFNTQDLRKPLAMHPELGVGMDAVDTEKRTRISSLLKRTIQGEIRQENLGEELRVLYVAMTRAKEKLILTGSVKKTELFLNSCNVYAEFREEKGDKLDYRFWRAKHYFDWVVPAAWGTGDRCPIRIRTISREELGAEEELRAETDFLEKRMYLQEIADPDSPLACRDGEFASRIGEQLAYTYPPAAKEELKLKYTVSELKKRASLAEEPGQVWLEEEEVVPLIPQFLKEEEKLTGAGRGSAYHRLLELLDFTRDYTTESLTEEADRLCREQKLSREMAACIRAEDIMDFLHTESGIRMRKAAERGKLFREQPFVLGADASRIYPKTTSEETILIQGIIDVWLEEEDGIVVLDYKTDRVRQASELRARYREQLVIYGEALAQMTGKQVKERIIYSFELKEEIPC